MVRWTPIELGHTLVLFVARILLGWLGDSSDMRGDIDELPRIGTIGCEHSAAASTEVNRIAQPVSGGQKDWEEAAD
jgi:hypothetical protein